MLLRGTISFITNRSGLGRALIAKVAKDEVSRDLIKY